MEVQTYEVISNDPSQGDNSLAAELGSPAAMELITQLGLHGQEKLLRRSGDDEPIVRNPYRLMTTLEMHVYQALFPKQTAIAQYADGPIPLRVLQVAAHASPMCGELFVWHPESGQDDPILVGKIRSPKGYGYVYYLLARWGASLLPFEQLREKAVELWKRQKLLAAKQQISEGERQIRDIDLLADAHFTGSDEAFAF